MNGLALPKQKKHIRSTEFRQKALFSFSLKIAFLEMTRFNQAIFWGNPILLRKIFVNKNTRWQREVSMAAAETAREKGLEALRKKNAGAAAWKKGKKWAKDAAEE